jgi:hypothetical protein
MILPRRLRVGPLLLTLLLTTGPLAAATYEHRPREARQSRLSFTSLLSEASALLSRMWENAGGPPNPVGKAGSGVDPFGNPTPNTQPPPSGTSSASQPSGK